MDEMMGVIKLFAGNFAPRGFMLCDGSILPISQYTALFSLLGTTYGGNGQTTFALPDLRGRAPIAQGQSVDGSNYTLGEVGGHPAVTLVAAQMPSHVHAIDASGFSATATVNAGTDGSSNSPQGNYWGTPAPIGVKAVDSYTATKATNMAADAVSVQISGVGNTGLAGGGQPFDNRPPYLALNYIICVEGIYPSRP